MTATKTKAERANAELRLLLLTRLREAAGRDVTEVRLTSYRRGSGRFWCVLVLGCDRREVPLPQGAPKKISDALRSAFPSARWSRAQDYDITTGVLTEHRTAMPACLLDGAR